MEAKVNIEKLQLLCDRISQAADALAQVRMSVSGLAHTAAVPSYGFGFAPLYGTPWPLQGVQPLLPWQSQPLTAPMSSLGSMGGNMGLHHSFDPRLQPVYYGTQVPVGYGSPMGMRHTGEQEVAKQAFEAQARDPYRLGRTFPFVFLGRPIIF